MGIQCWSAACSRERQNYIYTAGQIYESPLLGVDEQPWCRISSEKTVLFLDFVSSSKGRCG